MSFFWTNSDHFLMIYVAISALYARRLHVDAEQKEALRALSITALCNLWKARGEIKRVFPFGPATLLIEKCDPFRSEERDRSVRRWTWMYVFRHWYVFRRSSRILSPPRARKNWWSGRNERKILPFIIVNVLPPFPFPFSLPWILNHISDISLIYCYSVVDWRCRIRIAVPWIRLYAVRWTKRGVTASKIDILNLIRSIERSRVPYLCVWKEYDSR